MSVLTAAQQQACAAYWADINFVQAQITARYSTADLAAAVAALDNAFDTTLSTAVTAVGGSTTVINGLNAIIPAPFSGATVQQKTLLCCYTLMKRAGII
jgi:hypothetical protein